MFMNLYQRVKALADKKHLSIAELERTVGISNGQIRRWDKSSPKLENLSKVADYFNVTTDYLAGRTPTPQFTRRDERDVQKTLKEMFNGLSDKNALSYMKNGDKEIDEEDAELLRASLENAIRTSKILAKKKFTPKKYRNNNG